MDFAPDFPMPFDLNSVPSQQGKIAIVTGANTGLGYETTLGLIQTGMQVVMACRNLTKAEEAKASLLAQQPHAELEVMQLDLSQQSSVRTFAEQYRTQFPKLDLLINNAGIMFPPYETTVEALESQFAVNYLSHCLLTALLIDLMPDSPASRIVSLSSNAHKFGKLNFEDLQSEAQYSSVAAYGQSKLACLMFANELNRKLNARGTQLLSVCAHPGVSNTELARHIPKAIQLLLWITPLPYMAHAPEEAALPTLLAALGEDVKGGEYFGPQGPLEMSGPPGNAPQAVHAQDRAAAQKLWEISEQLLGVKGLLDI